MATPSSIYDGGCRSPWWTFVMIWLYRSFHSDGYFVLLGVSQLNDPCSVNNGGCGPFSICLIPNMEEDSTSRYNGVFPSPRCVCEPGYVKHPDLARCVPPLQVPARSVMMLTTGSGGSMSPMPVQSAAMQRRYGASVYRYNRVGSGKGSRKRR